MYYSKRHHSPDIIGLHLDRRNEFSRISSYHSSVAQLRHLLAVLLITPLRIARVIQPLGNRHPSKFRQPHSEDAIYRRRRRRFQVYSFNHATCIRCARYFSHRETRVSPFFPPNRFAKMRFSLPLSALSR